MLPSRPWRDLPWIDHRQDIIHLPMTVVTKDGQGSCPAAGPPESEIDDLTEEHTKEEVEPIRVSCRQARS